MLFRSGERTSRVAGHQAVTVDKHQGALRAEVPQVDRGRAAGAVVDALVELRLHRGEVLQETLDVGRTLKLDFFLIDDA